MASCIQRLCRTRIPSRRRSSTPGSDDEGFHTGRFPKGSHRATCCADCRGLMDLSLFEDALPMNSPQKWVRNRNGIPHFWTCLTTGDTITHPTWTLKPKSHEGKTFSLKSMHNTQTVSSPTLDEVIPISRSMLSNPFTVNSSLNSPSSTNSPLLYLRWWHVSPPVQSHKQRDMYTVQGIWVNQ